MDKLIMWGSILFPAVVAGGSVLLLGHPWWAAVAAITFGALGGVAWFIVAISNCRFTG